MSDRYPLPSVPDGWYGVGASAELALGDVRETRFFGRDLVLLRGEDGAARLFDAYCPHLGAHLAVGGRVEGEGLRCPFHGWRFDGAGRCVEVPGLERRPPAARLRAYPVHEAEGTLLAWFHARGKPPAWEVPAVREGPARDWTPWEEEHHEVRTHVQDMGENILDRAHFVHVHDMEDPGDARFDVRFEGPVMRVTQDMAMRDARGSRVASRTENWGPGISITRVDVGNVRSVTFITHTPVEAERVDFRLAFSMRHLDDPEATAAVARRSREVVASQARQDIPIWERKIYREKPVLTGRDGPVHEYRRWYRQFYSDPDGTADEGRAS